MKTLKLSKLRSRQTVEPKFRIRYPKKFSIKTKDASLTLLKNDLPWTLNPLPPPLPTSKTIKLEVDKSMPWALHPLPPPMKTKTNADYYWPGGKPQQKLPSKRPKSPNDPNNFSKNVRYKQPTRKPFADTDPSGFKPSDDHPDVDDKSPVDYKPDVYNNHVDHFKYAVDHKPDRYKHIDYKHVDYNHVDYHKSPDYKNDYPKFEDEDEHHYHHAYHNSYLHDDHTTEIIDNSPPPPPPSPSSESSSGQYVSHLSIEPSIQIASFTETELASDDDTNRKTVSENDASKQKCRCTVNGHRHKRDANNGRKVNGTGAINAVSMNATVTTTNAVQANDSNVAQSSRNAHIRPNVGHATDIQIIKSRDITEQSTFDHPTAGYVQQVRNGLNTNSRRPTGGNGGEPTTFRDESDKFKVDFGREINSWDESKPTPANKGRLSPLKYDDDDNSPDAGVFVNGEGDYRDGGRNDNGDHGHRLTRKPNRERGYRITKVENSDRGVAFSVQTPFSVSSFSSNVRHPAERQSQFRYTDDKPTSSPLTSSLQSEYSSEPLNFEQFGLQSALVQEDKSRDSGSLTTHFSRDFDDTPAVTDSQWTRRFPESFGGANKPSAGRLASHFSRNPGDGDRSRSNPFRYRPSPSDRFNGRLRGGDRPSAEDPVLEFFQPIVIDFDKEPRDGDGIFGPSGVNGAGDRSRFFDKPDSGGFSKFKKNHSLDRLRLPGRLHESDENLSRKTLLHPSTFDID